MNLMPRINYDTLLEVMWMCPRDDCARFMQTCRFLRNSGYCVLLSHPLHFHEEKEVLRLLEYLQLQNDWRSRHVRSMHFDMGAVELSESTALALAAALPRMHGLQELSISDSEYFLSSNQDLFHATGALTSLRSLHLTDMGEFAVEMLRSLQSELVNILLDFDVDTSFEDSEEELVCLPDLLAHSQATLQEVAIHRWYHLPDTRASDEPTTVKFPATRRLLLGQPLHPPLAVSYMRSFPTLSRLTLGTGESEMPDVEGVRKLNITDQGEPSCTWKALDELDGNLIDIYALALPCTVEQVHLGEVTLDTLHMVGPVLSNARPRRLYMDNWPVGKAQDPALDAFVAFRGQGGSRLEVLTMEVRLSNSNSDVDVATVLEELFAALAAGAPLQELRLDVKLGKVDPRPKKVITRPVPKRSRRKRGDPLPDIKEYPLTVAEQSVVNFDARDYLRRFTTTMPTLRMVNMKFDGVRGLRRVITLADGEVHVDGSW